jgi:hypothetical protein
MTDQAFFLYHQNAGVRFQVDPRGRLYGLVEHGLDLTRKIQKHLDHLQSSDSNVLFIAKTQSNDIKHEGRIFTKIKMMVSSRTNRCRGSESGGLPQTIDFSPTTTSYLPFTMVRTTHCSNLIGD